MHQWIHTFISSLLILLLFDISYSNIQLLLYIFHSWNSKSSSWSVNTIIYNERKLRMHHWGIASHIMKIFFHNMFLKNYSKIMMSFITILFMKDWLYKCIFYMSLKDYTNITSSCCHARLYTNFLLNIS